MGLLLKIETFRRNEGRSKRTSRKRQVHLVTSLAESRPEPARCGGMAGDVDRPLARSMNASAADALTYRSLARGRCGVVIILRFSANPY